MPVASVSLRQSLVPHRLQGRVSATARLLAEGAVPLGALRGGGLCAAYAGLHPAVVIAGAGTLLAFLWLLASPLRRLRAYPPDKELQA